MNKLEGFFLVMIILILASEVFGQSSIPSQMKNPGYSISLFQLVGLLTGLVFRTFVPYLIRCLKENKWNFAREYWYPPIFSIIIGIPSVIFLLPVLKAASGMWHIDFSYTFALAYAGQDIIREFQKLIASEGTS